MEQRDDATSQLLWQRETNEFIKCYNKQNRHSTGGSTVMYTHPSANVMLTLSKRASDGGAVMSRMVDTSMMRRQRQQRDLFSGDLGIPAIPPPPPPPPPAPKSRHTHVNNVVKTFETLALQRRLAAFEQKQRVAHKFSKYLKSNNNKLCKFKQRQSQQQSQQQLMAIAHTEIKQHNFNEHNKQIAPHYLQQLELDYRRNLFSNNNNNNNDCQKHKNNHNKCHNNQNNNNTNETERVVAVFDEMLAGYDDGNDDDDDDCGKSLHVSIININGNEAVNNVPNPNDTDVVLATPLNERVVFKPTTIKMPRQRQRHMKPPPPPPPPTTTTNINQVSNKSHTNANRNKCNVDNNTQLDNQCEFLRGTTLSQSFVHRKVKAKAPKPPTNVCRLTFNNPLRHILTPYKSFDLIT